MAKLKFQNELSLIFKEFLRSENQKNGDPSKWRKKFKFLLDREKILNFDAIEGSQIFAKKGIMTTLEPKPLKKGFGQEILQESTKFWILFTYYNKHKVVDIDCKEKVRRQIVDTFFETQDPIRAA